MKTSKAFRLTLPYLWDGVSSRSKLDKYVCHAAVRANVGAVVKPIIRHLLCPSGTLDEWLENRRIHTGEHDGLPKLQATRKAWILHLIEHYESKGD